MSIPFTLGGFSAATGSDIQPELVIPYIVRVENPELGPTDEQWSALPSYTRFFYPWNPESAPKTVLKLAWNGQKIYFQFSAVDADPIVFGDPLNKMDVCSSDRVEIFLDSSDKMTRYYGLEMDPSGRVLDYQVSYYRQFNYGYSFPGLKIRAQRTADGYRVTGSLDVLELNRLGLIHQERFLRAGFFRADFYWVSPEAKKRFESRNEAKDQAQTSDVKPILEKWISWKHTGTPEPDFHVPAALGWIELESPKSEPRNENP